MDNIVNGNFFSKSLFQLTNPLGPQGPQGVNGGTGIQGNGINSTIDFSNFGLTEWIKIIPPNGVGGSFSLITMSADGMNQIAISSNQVGNKSGLPVCYVSNDYGTSWSSKINIPIADWVTLAVSSSSSLTSPTSTNTQFPSIQVICANSRNPRVLNYMFQSTDYFNTYVLVQTLTAYNPSATFCSFVISGNCQYSLTAMPTESFGDTNSVFYSVPFKPGFPEINASWRPLTQLQNLLSTTIKYVAVSLNTIFTNGPGYGSPSANYPQCQTALPKIGQYLCYSNDGNVTWHKSQNILPNPSQFWSGITMSANGQYQTAISRINNLGGNGNIFISKNNSVTWSLVSSAPRNWVCVAMSYTGQYQVVGSTYDGLYFSTDYGETWQLSSNSPIGYWSSIAISSSGQYITGICDYNLWTTNIATLIGPTGISVIGNTGPTGPEGSLGPQGEPGFSSLTGATGPIGNTGYCGFSGVEGITTNTGATGVQGYRGARGVIGFTGMRGITTNTGATGPQGFTGNKIPGCTGGIGFTGSTGSTGPIGNTGPTGLPGNNSSVGDTGPTGTQGLPGIIVGINPSDYIYWNGRQWTVGDVNVRLGSFAGANNQRTGAVAIGYLAGNSNQQASAVAIGRNTGQINQGTGAVAIGNIAGQTSQRTNAVALGYKAGQSTQGTNAVAIGAAAGNFNQGTSAVAIGNYAGNSNQQASAVAIGSNAGQSRQQTSAVAIGNVAGYSNQGNSAVAIGYSAANSNQQASAVAIGSLAGYTNQGTNAVAIGTFAGQTSQGTDAVAIGAAAGNNIQKSSAVAIGSAAGNNNQQANAVALGYGAGYSNQRSSAVAIGYSAGYTGQGTGAVAMGYGAGNNNQKSSAVAIGNLAGYTNQGNYTVALGQNAGNNNQKSSAVAIGNLAGYTNQGSSAVAVGISAGNYAQGVNALAFGNSAGSSNQGTGAVALGYGAGNSNQQASAVAIGNLAGQASQGTNAIAIGFRAGNNAQSPYSILLNASSRIDVNAGTTGFFVNPIRSGTDGVTGGNSGANYILSYNNTTSELTYSTSINAWNLFLTGENPSTGGTGNVNNTNNNVYCNNVYASSAVYANNVALTSDYRIKENVKTLDDTFKVYYLNPVTYLNKQTKKQDIGLIAHELQEFYPELVSGEKDGTETQTINYIGLIPVLINEIKTLKNIIKIFKKTAELKKIDMNSVIKNLKDDVKIFYTVEEFK